jgi:nitrite reductase (NO-forming)
MTVTPRARERALGIVLGVVMVLAALSVAIFVGRDGGTGSVTVTGAGTRTLDVHLGDMVITPKVITVPVGTSLVLHVTNVDQQRHDLHIDGGPTTPILPPGGTATLHVGRITHAVQGWCTIPGHRAAGMTMSIAVTGAAATDAATAPPTGSMAMGGRSSGSSPAIDFAAKPGPDWKPYDPRLQPAPDGTVHRITFTVRNTSTEVAPGVKQTLWTYNGTAPGPILHGHVGDLFVVKIVNDTQMDHNIDFHAGQVSPDRYMKEIPPGGSLTYEFRAQYSGAWLYHCSTMPMALHIANGMYGAVIIDPPDLDKVAASYVFVQSELYLGAQNGVADVDKISARQPDAVVFNGYVNQYKDAPIKVKAGERIRVWVVDAGPQFGTSFHIVGTQFTTVFKEGAYLLRPDNPEHGAAQTLDLAPAQGGFVEFTLPAPGHYTFMDHAAVDADHGAEGTFLATK